MFNSLFRRNSRSPSLETTERPVDVDVIGSGVFRKCGSGFKSWKLRKFVLRSNCILTYYDTKSKLELGDEKGSLDISAVELKQGDLKNIKSSGAPENAVALKLTCLKDSRIIELVFDTVSDLKNLICLIHRVSSMHNLEVRALCITIIYYISPVFVTQEISCSLGL